MTPRQTGGMRIARRLLSSACKAVVHRLRVSLWMDQVVAASTIHCAFTALIDMHSRLLWLPQCKKNKPMYRIYMWVTSINQFYKFLIVRSTIYLLLCAILDQSRSIRM